MSLRNLHSLLPGCLLCFAFWIITPIESQEHQAKSEGSGHLITIQGKISYKPIPEKPWRFGRYYLHGTEKLLAEAVVELVPADDKIQLPIDAKRKIKTHLMDQENFMFIPETLAIQSGDKVRFKNSEEAYHNVMCLDDKPPFNVNLAKNQEHIHEPKVAKGAQSPLDIQCVFHGAMKGWIFVFDHPYFQQTTQSGAFKFSMVPPGSYKLRVAHSAGGLYLETEARQLGQSPQTQWNILLTPEHLKAQSE